MIGIINDAVRAYIIDIFGTDVWEACVAKGGPACEYAYVSACPYSDESTYKTLGALAEIQGMDLEDILEDAGFYFNTVYIQGKGYDKLLNSMGGNLVEFLQNLNFFHVHLSLGFKEMSPPAFSVDEVTPESCIFHYYSKRPGLTRFCVGLIRGAAEKMYNTPVEIEILERKGDERLDERPGAGISESGDAAGGGGIPQTVVADHDVLLVRFPPQSSVLQQYSTAATCRLALDPTTLFQLFPFHLVVDVDCRVVQAGRSLTRLYPELRPGRKLEDFFTLTHPYLPICFERIMERSDSVFLFRSKINGMELKGQMTYLQMPTGAPGDLTDANLDLDPDLLNTLGTGAGLATMPSAGASRGVTSGGAALASALVSAGIGAAGSGGAALSRNPMATLFSRMRPSQGEERGAGRSLSSSGTPGDGPDVAHRLMQPSPAQSRPGSNNRLSFPSSAVGSHRKPPSAVHSFTMPKGTITPAATTPRGLCSHDGSPQHRLRARPAPSCPHLASTTLAEDLQIPSPSDPSADPGEPPVVGISPTTPGEQCAAGGSGLGSPSQGLGTPGSGLGARYGSMGPGGLLTGSRRSSESGGAMLTRTHRGLRLNPGEHLQPVLLFLGSPRAGSIQEMRACGLYVSDLPLFDNSREMVLMAEQRAAEAALKDTYERLSVQFERRSEQLLYQLFPNFIADQLRKGERATAETYPEATILFSDIVGFTTISAESTPMEVCTMLDELYIEFDALIDKYPKVYKVETIGDAYMLVANVTEPCPNHVDMVLDFALDMHRVCSRVKTNQGVPLQIRVGIHTGSVVGGVVGRRMARFHLFGDAVNTASRMESHGVPGFVHISGASHALLKEPHKYLITERGEISVKGKGLMETFLVTGRDGPSTSGPASLPAAAGVVDSSHANAAAAAAAAAPSPARSSSSTPLPEPPAPAPPPAS